MDMHSILVWSPCNQLKTEGETNEPSSNKTGYAHITFEARSDISFSCSVHLIFSVHIYFLSYVHKMLQYVMSILF